MKTLRFILIVAVSFMTLAGCANWSNTGKGAAIGAGSGGALGGLIGKNQGNTAGGAIIGAAVGGAAGAAIGKYMDKQAEELAELENAEVERIGEGIKLTFESGILFGFDDFELTPDSQESVMELARILNEYPDTYLLVEGHTDDQGSEKYNQNLSEKRASSVANYLKMQGVLGERITTKGFGLENPVADNDTEEGRAQNRRVEVAIWANEELKEKAETGTLSTID